MRGNLWKSRAPRDHQKLVDLRKSIATKLLERDDVPGFVIFHVDGDTSFCDREESENVARFEEFASTYIQPIVEKALRDKGREAEIATRMKRLVRITPFYSIEAWLYQNTAEARRLCQESYGDHDHLKQISEWDQDRGRLDEIEKPKDALCIRDRYNHELATKSYPVDDVYEANKSFADAVNGLLGCDELTTALKRTYATEDTTALE